MNQGSDSIPYPLVAVAINREKTSQSALKWTIENLVSKGQILTLVHVNTHPPGVSASLQNDGGNGYKNALDLPMKELFLPFRCFCTRKDVDTLQ